MNKLLCRWATLFLSGLGLCSFSLTANAAMDVPKSNIPASVTPESFLTAALGSVPWWAWVFLVIAVLVGMRKK